MVSARPWEDVHQVSEPRRLVPATQGRSRQIQSLAGTFAIFEVQNVCRAPWARVVDAAVGRGANGLSPGRKMSTATASCDSADPEKNTELS